MASLCNDCLHTYMYVPKYNLLSPLLLLQMSYYWQLFSKSSLLCCPLEYTRCSLSSVLSVSDAASEQYLVLLLVSLAEEHKTHLVVCSSFEVLVKVNNNIAVTFFLCKLIMVYSLKMFSICYSSPEWSPRIAILRNSSLRREPCTYHWNRMLLWKHNSVCGVQFCTAH